MLPPNPRDLRPPVLTGLNGQGRVVQHEPVIDSLGKFHGLYRLVVQGEAHAPEVSLWEQMLPETTRVVGVLPDLQFTHRILIYYKSIEERQK